MIKFNLNIAQIKSDFDYGRNNGIGYVATFFSFATYMEIMNVNRLLYIFLIFIAILITWFWGFFLRKTGFRKKEMEMINKQNNELMKIYQKLINNK